MYKKLGENFTPLGVEIQNPARYFLLQNKFPARNYFNKGARTCLVLVWIGGGKKPRFRQLLCVDQNDFFPPRRCIHKRE